MLKYQKEGEVAYFKNIYLYRDIEINEEYLIPKLHFVCTAIFVYLIF